MLAYGSPELFKFFIPAAFLFGLLALGVLVAIGAFRSERKRRESAEAAHTRLQALGEFTDRSEERAIAHIKRTEEHYDRVETMLKTICDKLSPAGGGA